MKTFAMSPLSRLLCASFFLLLLLPSLSGSSRETSTVAASGCRAADFDTNFLLINRLTVNVP